MADISKVVTPSGDEYNLKDTTARAASATMIGATSSTNGVGGTVPAPLMGDEKKVLMGSGTWENVDVDVDVDNVIKVTLSGGSGIPIPASGSSVRYNVTGMTANHELIRWNFSSSAENWPPANLTVTTANGYFTIQNTSGSTNENIKPVFAIPIALTAVAN